MHLAILKYFNLILTLLFICSCSIFNFPESYDSIEGEHCIVLMTRDDVSYETYYTICTQGDIAFEEAVSLTGLDFTRKILITYDRIRNENENLEALAYVHDYVIFLKEPFFELSTIGIQNILRHEITHVLVITYFGLCNSPVFTEGIAVYIEQKMILTEPSEIQDLIEDVLGLSYLDFHNSEFRSEYYKLSGEFTAFWCKTYGMDNFFNLYKNVSTLNYREKIEENSGQPFDSVIADFKINYYDLFD